MREKQQKKKKQIVKTGLTGTQAWNYKGIQRRTFNQKSVSGHLIFILQLRWILSEQLGLKIS